MGMGLGRSEMRRGGRVRRRDAYAIGTFFEKYSGR